MLKKEELENVVNSQINRMQVLEADLIRTKQDLGEALNTMQELEAEHTEFRGVLEKKMTFKEFSPDCEKLAHN